MDKILLGMGRNEGKVEVTNDGATILKNIGVDNPAAKVMVDMSRVQDAEVGDGTTSVVVFSSELIREAEKMIEMRIHPQTIVAGWRQATKVARQALESSAKDLDFSSPQMDCSDKYWIWMPGTRSVVKS